VSTFFRDYLNSFDTGDDDDRPERSSSPSPLDPDADQIALFRAAADARLTEERVDDPDRTLNLIDLVEYERAYQIDSLPLPDDESLGEGG
jgi:hypothetical protein